MQNSWYQDVFTSTFKFLLGRSGISTTHFTYSSCGYSDGENNQQKIAISQEKVVAVFFSLLKRGFLAGQSFSVFSYSLNILSINVSIQLGSSLIYVESKGRIKNFIQGREAAVLRALAKLNKCTAAQGKEWLSKERLYRNRHEEKPKCKVLNKANSWPVQVWKWFSLCWN